MDPWGGDGYLSTILRTVKPAVSSEYSATTKLSEAKDYFASAQKELTVREQSAGLVRRVSTCGNTAVGNGDVFLTMNRSRRHKI
jgi:hypothetical protein